MNDLQDWDWDVREKEELCSAQMTSREFMLLDYLGWEASLEIWNQYQIFDLTATNIDTILYWAKLCPG